MINAMYHMIEITAGDGFEALPKYAAPSVPCVGEVLRFENDSFRVLGVTHSLRPGADYPIVATLTVELLEEQTGGEG